MNEVDRKPSDAKAAARLSWSWVLAALKSISVRTAGSSRTNLQLEWTHSRVSIEMENRSNVSARHNVRGDLHYEEGNLEAMSNAA